MANKCVGRYPLQFAVFNRNMDKFSKGKNKMYTIIMNNWVSFSFAGLNMKNTKHYINLEHMLLVCHIAFFPPWNLKDINVHTLNKLFMPVALHD